MSRPVVALLTDFGLGDHYVGAMKGAVLSVCRDAALVDITHDIPPQDVMAGALELAAAFASFPSGTVFLAVVDPGVGSPRRRLAAEGGGYRFVGPDNGVLSLALGALPSFEARELVNAKYRRETVSRTFEGRDWFAPVAGWLASGLPIDALGPLVADIERIDLPRPRLADGSITGEVLRVDRFGNLVTNVDRTTIANTLGDAPRVSVGDRVLDGLVETYSAVEHGALCALIGSTGHLEIATSGGSAAAALNAGRGTLVRLSRNA